MSNDQENNIENFDYKCMISKNAIEYKCYKKEKEAHMEYYFIDQNIYKSFFLVLRTSIDALKKKGYTKIVQTVSEDDWNNFLKKDNKWNIKNTVQYPNAAFNVIECDINNALGCISRGLGLNS